MRVASTYSLGVAMLLVLSLLAPSARARFQAPQTPQDVPAPPSAEQKPGTAAARFIPAQLKLRTFHTIFVHSDTVYLKTEDLRNTVMNRVEMHGWKIDVAGKGIADVLVEVTRPFLTFDWKYRITDRATGEELGAGQIVAWDGRRAAEGIAADLVGIIGRVRPLPVRLLAAATDEPSARRWRLQYIRGGEGTRESGEVIVSVSSNRVVGRRQGRLLFVIPTKKVSAVGYNPRTIDPSKGWDAFWESAFRNIGNDPNSILGAVMLVPVALGGEAFLKQFKSQEHLCEIAWIEEGAMRNVVLKADDSTTAHEFRAAVEEASNRKAIDMAAEATALEESIEREDREGRSLPVQLDRKTSLGWRKLEPGVYRVVMLERQPGRAVAYFLKSGAATESVVIAAQMPVEIEPGVSDSAPSVVRYREVNGIPCLDAIVTPGKTFRFRAIPLELASESQITDDVAELLAKTALKPKYRSIKVDCHSMYLKRETMERALAQHPAIKQWELKIVPPNEQADLVLTVTPPYVNFDWTYTVTEVETGRTVVDGKVTADNGGLAAIVIANQVVRALTVESEQ
jgi:hypothetical protein